MIESTVLYYMRTTVRLTAKVPYLNRKAEPVLYDKISTYDKVRAYLLQSA